MKLIGQWIVALLAVVLCGASLNAQQPAWSTTTAVVPRLVSFSGKAVDAQGKAISAIASATFAIYKDQYEGAPLWMETQSIHPDPDGKYAVQLGATKSEGLPLELFATVEARWLGVRIGDAEELPRVLLLSVPYALKAADADTLGGKPLSAFQLVSEANGSANNVGSNGAPATGEQANEIVCSSTTACGTGFIPEFTTTGGSAKVSNSLISQSGSTVTVNGNASAKQFVSTVTTGTAPFTVSSTTQVANLNASLLGGVSASAFATLGANNFAGNQTTTGTDSATSSTTADAIFGQNTGAGIGVHGLSNTGAGVWGENTAGQTGAGGDGVHGVSSSVNGAGVAGVNTTPGFGTGVSGNGGLIGVSGVGAYAGVYGSSSGGWGFVTSSNVSQDRAMGGWVKAMAFIGLNGIATCFNSTLGGSAATTVPCGFTFSKPSTGNVIIDFGFEVDDRFISVTSTIPSVTTSVCTDFIGVTCNNTLTTNQIEVSTWSTTAASYADAKFYIIVY